MRIEELPHPPGIQPSDPQKLMTHSVYHVCSIRYGLIQLVVVNSWCLVYTFGAAKPFHRSHTESSLTRMIFLKKSTYLLVCPSPFFDLIPNKVLEVLQGRHDPCKLKGHAERAFSSPTPLLQIATPTFTLCCVQREANLRRLVYKGC